MPQKVYKDDHAANKDDDPAFLGHRNRPISDRPASTRVRKNDESKNHAKEVLERVVCQKCDPSFRNERPNIRTR